MLKELNTFFKQESDLSNIVKGAKSTGIITTKNNVHAIHFFLTASGTAATRAEVLTDVGNIIIRYQGKQIFELTATQILDLFKFKFDTGVKKTREISELFTRYYLRFSAIDRPGVLAGISDILAKSKISIATVSQKEKKTGQPVPIVMLTHQANEGRLNKALAKISKLKFITKKAVKMRIVR